MIESRRWSLRIMILMIIAAMLFGSHRTLAKMSSETTAIFYNGVDNDGYGIQSDLDRVIDSASKLISMAKLYAVGTDLTLVEEAGKAQSALYQASTISAKYSAYLELDNKISLLYYALDKYDLSQAHKVSKTTLYYDIAEVKEKIGHSAYNTYADQFNEVLDTFPANILSKATFVSKVDAFR